MSTGALSKVGGRATPLAGPNGRFGFVDDLRGIAAIIVVLSHMVWLLPEPLPRLEIGRVGVEIFFVLSGFVMAYTLERERVTGRFAAKFMLRRSIRLDPPYWTVIVVELIVVAVLFGQSLPSLRVLALNVLYLQDLAGAHGIVGVAWTLCLELQFYLVFVLLLWVVQRLPMSKWGARVLIFAPPAVLSACVSHLIGKNDVIDELGGLGGLFIGPWYLFFLGVLVKWVLFDRLDWWIAAALPVFVVGLIVVQGEPLVPYDNYVAVAGVAAAVVLVTVGWTARFGGGLGMAPIAYLGKISYSLYLIHYTIGTNFILKVHERFGPGYEYQIPAAVVAIAVSLGAAHLLYVAVEAPSVQLAARAKNWRFLRS